MIRIPCDVSPREVDSTCLSKLLKLLESPGIPQRTPEWYAVREKLITASDVAQALGKSKFGTVRGFYQKKCGLPEERPVFNMDCPPLKWGTMYEPVAQRVYSALNGDKHVYEFGLLLHPSISFLGASPDGITEDGVMLEIKCPYRRKISDIQTSDEGAQCAELPTQYYYQIQAQLEVCDLSACDYFECEFEEHDVKEVGGEGRKSWENAAYRGLVCEFHRDDIECRFVYAPLDASFDTLKTWEDALQVVAIAFKLNMTSHWWSLRKHQTVRVCRDQAFIDRMVKELSFVWERVQMYKNDRERFVLDMYKNTISKPRRSKYLFRNTMRTCADGDDAGGTGSSLMSPQHQVSELSSHTNEFDPNLIITNPITHFLFRSVLQQQDHLDKSDTDTDTDTTKSQIKPTNC